MRLLIYQTFSENNAELFRATEANHREYCIRHNYSFLAENCEYSPFLDTEKIRKLLELFDMVVTVGSDCVFTDFARKLEDFLPDGKNIAVCEEGSGKSFVNGEINFFRSAGETRDFLNWADAKQRENCRFKWGWQSVLNVAIRNADPMAERLHLIPAGTLQTYLADAARFAGCRWRPGGFLAHALGGDNASKLERVRTLQGHPVHVHAPSVTVTDTAPVDVVIPLSGESCSDNDELRLALRSVEKHVKNLGKVWLVTDNPPAWVRNVRVLPVTDCFRDNKDANLFRKLLAAARMPECAEKFIFLSDDQCFLTDFDPHSAKTVYNPRGRAKFEADAGKWHRRMLHTLDCLKSRGIELDCNFDAHVPVVYGKREFCRVLRDVDYCVQPGYCINTLVCGLLHRKPEVLQDNVKCTFEGGTGEISGAFCGYNDAGFKAGLREKLFAVFPEKSKFEKEA